MSWPIHVPPFIGASKPPSLLPRYLPFQECTNSCDSNEAAAVQPYASIRGRSLTRSSRRYRAAVTLSGWSRRKEKKPPAKEERPAVETRKFTVRRKAK
jgi:hypothetical protein